MTVNLKFYHACDQEYYSFCIFNYDGLQLADFISSYTSFTITILSMSAFVRKWKVFTFFVGLLACLSINLYDRFSSVTFIIAASISASVTITSWVSDANDLLFGPFKTGFKRWLQYFKVHICISKRKMYPNKCDIIKFYLPGLVLAMSGLIIYTCLQTKNNYFILHSVWHICMAISILFFLPKRSVSAKGTCWASTVLALIH